MNATFPLSMLRALISRTNAGYRGTGMSESPRLINAPCPDFVSIGASKPLQIVTLYSAKSIFNVSYSCYILADGSFAYPG